MRRAYYRKYVYHTLLCFISALLYLWQNSINAFPEIAGLRALPLIPFIVCITVFNPETAGIIYGVVAGLVMDISWSRTSGFNALTLFVICAVLGLLIRFLFTRSLASVLMLSGIICLVYFLIYWLCFCVFAGLKETAYCLFSIYLPMAVYTWVFTIPSYFLVGFMTDKFRND